MTPRTRTILITAASFTVVAAALASPAWLPALAATSEPVSSFAAQTAVDIFTPPPPDYGRLVRRHYEIDPSVSTKPVRQSVVRKIEAGRITDVVVVETATGVYSSDGLADSHVSYPGIRVTDETFQPIEISLMIDGAWVSRPALSANSILEWPAKN